MKEKIRVVFRFLLAAFMVWAGINHFRDPDFYLRGMPDYLPYHLELVYISGVAEIVLGIMILFAATRRLGAWLMVAMLVVFLAVHIDMAIHAREKFADVSMVFIWLRIPFQFVYIWWVVWSTKLLNGTKVPTNADRTE